MIDDLKHVTALVAPENDADEHQLRSVLGLAKLAAVGFVRRPDALLAEARALEPDLLIMGVRPGRPADDRHVACDPPRGDVCESLFARGDRTVESVPQSREPRAQWRSPRIPRFAHFCGDVVAFALPRDFCGTTFCEHADLHRPVPPPASGSGV